MLRKSVMVFGALALMFGSAAAADITLPCDAIVIGDVVNVRRAPDAGAAVVGVVREGDKVSLLAWEAAEVTIGAMRDRWARVKLASGTEGYAFGAFLFEEPAIFSQWWDLFDTRKRDSFRLRKSWETWEGYGTDGKLYTRGGVWVRGRALELKPALMGSPSTWLYLHRFHGKRCLAPTRIAPSSPDSAYSLWNTTSGGQLPLGYYFERD